MHLFFNIGCGIVSHPSCAEATPNTCGLPQTLASQIYTMSPPKKTKHDNTPSSGGSEKGTDMKGTSLGIVADSASSSGKENIHSTSAAKISRKLSIDLIRCQVSSTPSSTTKTCSVPDASGETGERGGRDMTDLSITSSMLEESSCSMEDLV